MKTALHLVFVLTIGSSLTAQESLIREESRSIKTYPFSDPDPVPILGRNPKIYPYFSFDGYSQTGRPKAWKVVRLENDHIQVLVLPEIGGKVFGAIEKKSQEAFIYLNDAIKFRRIAMRGPWTSGGIEFNFGIVGHSPATATPVDYRLKKNPDGSASCFVGALDLPSRTRWTVEIRLPPDKAYFETKAAWHNPTPLNQSYYSWTTAAVQTSEKLQYFYPGDRFVPHSYSADPDTWPVDLQGRDLSWYRNSDFAGNQSRFIIGEYAHHFATFDHEAQLGLGHWSLYNDMPGQKMWIWAQSRQGGIWEDLLTDGAGQYSEPQSGRLFSQTDHEFFAPYTADSWRELWFPVKTIGGISVAAPDGVLYVAREQDSLKISILALAAIQDTLGVNQDGSVFYREPLSLNPLEVVRRKLPLPAGSKPVMVSYGDELTFNEDTKQNKLKRPIDFHPVDESTVEGLYLAGEYHEKRREFDRAMGNYSAVLAKDSLHTRAMVRLAELAYRRGEFKKGRELAGRALRINMYDPDANYIYGVIARKLGDLVDARETLGWAARSLNYRSNAYAQLAEICVLEGRFEMSLEYGRRALLFNGLDINAMEILAIAYRRLGHRREAEDVLENLTKTDPLNHLVDFERYLLTGNSGELDLFNRHIQSELPQETYLELAIKYSSLGLTADSRAVLRQAPEHPMVLFWLAFLSVTEERESILEEAIALSPAYVFPHRIESIPVLEWVLEQRPESWKARYYLGLLYWGVGRHEVAKTFFSGVGQPDFAPFHLANGLLNPEQAKNSFQRAVRIDPDEWRTWHYLIREFDRSSDFKRSLGFAEEAIQLIPGRTELLMDHANALNRNGRFQESLTALEELEVLPYEGSWEAHDLFFRNHIELALEMIKEGRYRKALEHLDHSSLYPEHLGSGKPHDPDYRTQDYLAIICYGGLKSSTRAEEFQQKVYEYTMRNWLSWGGNHELGLLILNQLGKSNTYEKLLVDWEAEDPEGSQRKWVYSKLKGNRKEAEQTKTELLKNPQASLRIRVFELIKSSLHSAH